MRVLVTGTPATSARSSCPYLANTGTRWSASTPTSTTVATSARTPASLADRRSTFATSRPAHLEGFDAVVHLAALSNDPLGDLEPELTSRSTPRDAAARSRGRARPASGGSSSRRRARCTAPPTRTTLLDEDAPLRPLTPYAESKVRAEEGLAELAGDDFVAGVDAERHRVRRLAAAAARHRPQQPRGLGAHDRARSGCSATGRPGGRCVHVRDVAKVGARDARGAGRSSFAARRSTSAPARRTTSIRELAELLAEVTGCEVELAERRVARPAFVPRRLLGARSGVPAISNSNGTARRGAEELVAAYRRSALTTERSRGAHTSAFDNCATFWTGELADGDLRGTRLRCGSSRRTRGGVVVVELEEHLDERGSFARTWSREEMAEAGLAAELAQCSFSRNPRAGTLRGCISSAPQRRQVGPLHPGRDLRRRGRPSPRLPDAGPLGRGRARCGERPGPLRARGVRPRPPDARRRHATSPT